MEVDADRHMQAAVVRLREEGLANRHVRLARRPEQEPDVALEYQ